MELSQRLRADRGLQLSAVVDGIGEKLHELVAFATHPDVMLRPSTVREFLEMLADVEEELTRPEESIVRDPTEALAGDKLPGGLVVISERQQANRLCSSRVVSRAERT